MNNKLEYFKMAKTLKILLSLSFATFFCKGVLFSQNPIVQTSYTADPAPMVYDGTVYLYTSHDEDVTVRNFFTMNDWKCYSW